MTGNIQSILLKSLSIWSLAILEEIFEPPPVLLSEAQAKSAS